MPFKCKPDSQRQCFAVSCKLTRNESIKFKQLQKRLNISINKLVHLAVMSYISDKELDYATIQNNRPS